MDFPEQRAPESVDGFTLQSVLIESDRLASKIGVENATTDLDIYEHIDKPYLTASLIFIDAAGIFSGMDFIGGEKVTIVIKSTRAESTSITKIFYVTSVMNTKKVNDYNEVIGLNLIEDIAYYANLINVNKSYFGKCSKMIEKIFKDNFDKTVTKIGEDYQQKFKVIIPNLNPIESVSWIKNKATDVDGLPFFLFSTLVGDDIKFASLSEMLNQQVMNPSLPFTYWQAGSTSPDRDIQRRTILSYEYSNVEDIFKLIESGVVGSNYTYLDTLNGSHTSFQFDVMNDAFKPMLDRQTNAVKPKTLPFDERLKFDGISINQIPSKNITQVGSSGVYNQAITHTPSYSEEFDLGSYKKKAISRAILKFLVKSPLTVMVNGYDFIDGQSSTTIGNKLKIEFINSTIHSDGEDRKDPKRSGDYLIYATRHMFKKERYDLALSCVKIGNHK